jgi:hypothetical protein
MTFQWLGFAKPELTQPPREHRLDAYATAPLAILTLATETPLEHTECKHNATTATAVREHARIREGFDGMKGFRRHGPATLRGDTNGDASCSRCRRRNARSSSPCRGGTLG